MDIEAIRQLTEARRNREGNARLELKVEPSDSVKFTLNNGWSYDFQQKGDLVYVNSRVYPINAQDFKRFCGGLLGQIQAVEGEAVARAELWGAGSALNSILAHRDNCKEETAEECFRKITEVYERQKADLADFPIWIFSSYDIHAPEQILTAAMQMLLDAGNEKEGQALVIAGVRNLQGFRKEDTMLFGPIDNLMDGPGEYYTHEEEGAELRASLAKYSQE